MAYSIILTIAEITELKHLRRTEKEGKILRRYQCIWMANENFPKKEIAFTLGVSIDTVTDWVKIFSKERMVGLRTLHYAGRRPSRLDIIKDLINQHIKDLPVSKLFGITTLFANQTFPYSRTQLAEPVLKKKLYCSYKKTRLIPGKVPLISVQEEFIGLMEQLYNCACYDSKQVLLYLDPMHQVHNNENDYAWQPKGIKGTKTVLANTGRRRLNIIGAINPLTFQPTIVLTEENCCAEVIEAFLQEVKKQYHNASTICIILDNARYQRSYAVQQKAKDLNIDLLYLPAYSPNLNLIERLWRYFKKKIMKNKYYPDFTAFENEVDLFFKNFDERIPDMKSLLNFKFGIIKAN